MRDWDGSVVDLECWGDDRSAEGAERVEVCESVWEGAVPFLQKKFDFRDENGAFCAWVLFLQLSCVY